MVIDQCSPGAVNILILIGHYLEFKTRNFKDLLKVIETFELVHRVAQDSGIYGILSH
jgi:hypothetical protein